MAEWRSMRPTSRKERKAGEKDTHLVVWTNGLMGVYAEAEVPGWAAELTADETELAMRYAMLESNSLPSWTADRFRMLSATHEIASADRPSVVTSWQDDPYSRGAYPAPAPGEVTRLGPKLYAAHGPLQFAGDFDYAFGGYMEGAARGGVRAAGKILREMG
ncbi:MAG: hypothetical protein EOO77_40990 [Oxalobacteraceae bacterium]|nr:MAG: hypothetical protein EOO77_40990 [Oxalobacteraceae bacterium]